MRNTELIRCLRCGKPLVNGKPKKLCRLCYTYVWRKETKNGKMKIDEIIYCEEKHGHIDRFKSVFDEISQEERGNVSKV